LLRLPPGQVPSTALLATLHRAWGNEDYSANLPYLEEVARRAATADGPILECGSGLTTILLAAVAGRRGVPVHSLEHTPEWHRRVASVLRRCGIPGVRLHLVPLVDHGSFAWYEIPSEDWPSEFCIAICDGPPSETKGGRYGLLPRVGAKLPAGALIVLDDATRPPETAMRHRWRAERDLVERVYPGPDPDRAYAVLILR
jgi:predicted O-methyltransferase YrrM